MIDVANMLFFVRNGNRAQGGEGGRAAVAIAQGTKFVNQVSQYDNMFAKGTKSALNAFNKIAENDKLFKGISKGVNFAKDHVNSLIVVSSGLNVITSKDKKTELICESGNLLGMFAMEGWMKKNLDKYIQKLPVSNKWKPIVRGITFVAGSIGASTLCYNIAKKIAKSFKTPRELEAQEAENKKFVPKNIAYCA